MDDVCDFEVELEINDKNEVEYNIIKSDVSKLLKSGSGLERTVASLALRCVLSKISHLPTPNFITFDEVLGKVAAVNIEKIKPMFEKIKDMFDIVFFITHNELVKDWGDKVITITKVKDISFDIERTGGTRIPIAGGFSSVLNSAVSKFPTRDV